MAMKHGKRDTCCICDAVGERDDYQDDECGDCEKYICEPCRCSSRVAIYRGASQLCEKCVENYYRCEHCGDFEEDENDVTSLRTGGYMCNDCFENNNSD